MLITPDQVPPISSEEMMDVCRRFTSCRDYHGLLATSLDPEAGPAPGIWKSFRVWEISLRNDLAILRAAAQNLSSDKFLRKSPGVLGTSSIAAEAMSGKSPLEAELYLDGCRWAKIEELCTGHYFDIEYLRAYRMKLQILERHVKFEEEKGFAAYRVLYTRVLEATGTVEPTGGEGA
jgi:hypothetical protein